jgi:acyl-coenzyme A synthetase/AMP-(fatty) acid ligase
MGSTMAPTFAELTTQSRTIPEFLDHGKNIINDALGFPRNSFADLVFFSPQQVWRMADRVTDIYLNAGLESLGPGVTVGLRGMSTIEWVVSFLALTRLGHPILILASTLSVEAVEKVMNKSNCEILIDQTDAPSTLTNLKKLIIPMATVRDGDKEAADETDTFNYRSRWPDIKETDTAFIMHSTGTTGLPKLVARTHRQVLHRLKVISPGLTHLRVFIDTYFCYSNGLFSMLYALMRDGQQTCWSNERLTPTPGAYRDLVVAMKPQLAFFRPRMLMDAVSTPDGLDVLKRSTRVFTTGMVMPRHLGTKLVEEGVPLINLYSMTELTFGLMGVLGDPDWEYLQADPFNAPHIHFRPLSEEESSMQAGGQQLYELVVLPSHPTQDMQWANPADRCFHTGDVFVPHPTKLNRYKCMGRLCDDVKIRPEQDLVRLNPLQYEHAVMAGNQDILDEAVLFGNGRPEAVMLLFVRPGTADSLTDDAVREHAWEMVQRDVNDVLPAPLRRNMLVVVRDAVIPRTPKWDVARTEAYKKFEKLIDVAYGCEPELNACKTKFKTTINVTGS